MNITDRAIIEMELANFEKQDIDAMRTILECFFQQWNSGGAVWVMVPVLHRLLHGLPLTPLTGADDEWRATSIEGAVLFQNIRCSHVFKQGFNVWDSENAGWDGTFPYMPNEANLDPVIKV